MHGSINIKFRKRSSGAGSEKMERVGEGKGKMERYCLTGQSPQRAVAPTEEEEEDAQVDCSKNVKIYMRGAATCFCFSQPSSGS